jgi:protein-disulfide isomerase
MTVAALVLAAAVAHREFTQQRVDQSQSLVRPVYHRDWKAYLAAARALGDTGVPVELIEFGDLECPACRQFHATVLPEIHRAFRDRLSIRFVHLPLRIHRFARPAALAAECAAEQGRFSAFIEKAYQKQDSIGLAPWSSLAAQAGVANLKAFESCRTVTQSSLVDSGMALAKRLDVHSTPTILVNGWLVPSPTREELNRVISAVLEGQSPYKDAEVVGVRVGRSP